MSIFFSFQVRRGDRILAVNGGDISGATHEEAAMALKKAGNVVQLTLYYRPEDYEKFEAKINSLKNQIVAHSMIGMSEKRDNEGVDLGLKLLSVFLASRGSAGLMFLAFLRAIRACSWVKL